MSVKIKICGMTNGEDALAGLRAGADYIGMVFYPKSPRYVSPERAEHIVQLVQGQGFPDARFIGVFVNEPPKKAAGLVERLGLFAAQIHGDEPEEYFEHLGSCRFIRTIRVKSEECLSALGRGRAAWAWLCDAYSEQYGGAGKKIDAAMLAPYVSRHRIFLAGGLTPENISDALKQIKPYGVDVSSGVEIAPGKKSHEKIMAFIKSVKEADNGAKNKNTTS